LGPALLAIEAQLGAARYRFSGVHVVELRDPRTRWINVEYQIPVEQPQCPSGASCPQRKIDQMTIEIACEGMTRTSAGAPTCTTVRSLTLIRDP
jgi:hypothetical protein